MLELIFLIVFFILIYELRKYARLTDEVKQMADELGIDPETGKPLPKKAEKPIEFTGTFRVAGVYYYKENIKKIVKKKRPTDYGYVYKIKEDFVILKPEPDNIADPNAIAVYMNNELIGYVPANLTHAIRPLINNHYFIGSIRCGDKWCDGEIVEDSFICEVIMEDED